jgi:hypothetical protein
LAARIVEKTLQSKPRGQTHWSSRQMARSIGVHHSTVARVWQDHELKPHRHTTFKLSRDPNYAAKLIDVVGVYLSPPEHAVVLCVDEKSQIQALDRTQPGLPLKRGRASSWTHDYVRNGTTTLFAALEVAKGKVTGQCYAKHRHQEFLKFLRHLDDEYVGDQELHLILDNYGTHKHEKVRRWLDRHRSPPERDDRGHARSQSACRARSSTIIFRASTPLFGVDAPAHVPPQSPAHPPRVLRIRPIPPSPSPVPRFAWPAAGK